jgi:hypothetical protein
MVGMVASLAIFAVVFFTVIKPSENTANQALKSGLQQSQQAISQAQKQVSSAGGQASASTTKALGNAAKLTSCVSAAGTDATAIQACQAKFGH